MHLVQIGNGTSRRVAVVDEPHLSCLDGSRVDLRAGISDALRQGQTTLRHAQGSAPANRSDYDAIYSGKSRMATARAHRCARRTPIASTGLRHGLTHLGSAKDRQAMHLQPHHRPQQPMTDSMRMFEWGVDRRTSRRRRDRDRARVVLQRRWLSSAGAIRAARRSRVCRRRRRRGRDRGHLYH